MSMILARLELFLFLQTRKNKKGLSRSKQCSGGCYPPLQTLPCGTGCVVKEKIEE